MEQHRAALEEIGLYLALLGYSNHTANRAEFGEFCNVVGMAFDYWSQMDIMAERAGYENDDRNAAADKAYEAYEAVRDLAKELTAPRRVIAIGNETGITEVAPGYEDEQAALDDLDSTYNSLGVVR